ncbi:MAG: hypothetical protein CFE21_02985 [Bacteroidetes bacterium B1(2017)]|nr:MAG: hypothetical protein CFE21_02985 [Bacteroidetes bacterium B1(2017)]
MKKLLTVLLLTGMLSNTWASNHNQNDKTGSQKKASCFRIEQATMQSTVVFDGDMILKFGIVSSTDTPIKVQLIWDNTSLMSANYTEQIVSDGFNLGQLPAATYKIRISHGNEVVEKEFVKTTDSKIIFE